jgi:hypothetical protein
LLRGLDPGCDAPVVRGIVLFAWIAAAARAAEIRIGYLRRETQSRPRLSLLDMPSGDGLAGARRDQR